MFDDFCAFERMLSVNVSLPSGRNESLKVPELSTVGDLQVLAQESFGQKFLRLVTSKNVALTNPKDSLQAARDPRRRAPNCFRPTGATRRHIVSPGAFAAILADGSVVTWGNSSCSGDSSAVQHRLRNVKQIAATESAIATVLSDRLYSPDLGVFTFWWQQLCSSR